MSDLLLRGGRIVDPANGIDEPADLLVEGGVISAVEARIHADAKQVIDVGGLVVAPGFIDSHVHLREPGFEHKETIASATAAAAAGGICVVVAMPNTNPPPDTAERVESLLVRARERGSVRVHTVGCISQGRQGQELAPLEELAAAGAIAFSDDGDPVESSELMGEGLRRSAALNLPLFPHEEMRSLTAGGCMHEGDVSRRMNLPGMPSSSEERMIQRDVDWVRKTGGALHVMHISTEGAVQLVREAKTEGLPVTCEVLPHHFVLTDEEVERQSTAAKMSPPLRAASDVAATRVGLADGTIDTIATDHAPHSAEEKAQSMESAPMGIVGLETAIGLTLTCLVGAGVLTLSQAIAKWTSAPAQIFGLPGGTLTVGTRADITVIDPDRRWVVDSRTFRSLSRNTPFDGFDLIGKAMATIVDGDLVYDDLEEMRRA
ncbi:MAG: dihydroorotase [Candidatus Latescibacterota bacterium]|nr:dihydroorotase [Candidatus Latescibacterota bacterium]